MSTRTLAILVPFAAFLAPASAQWHNVATASAPSPRSLAGGAYDLARAQTLLFGGVHTAAPFQILGDTWTFDGTAWTQHAPATTPTPRPGTQPVYDFARGVVVLYGGTTGSLIGGPSSSDTWEWDGTNWTQIATPANAGPRGRYGAAYDVARGRTVLYGGIASTQLLGALAGTWEYDGVTWTQITTSNSPGALQDPAMCYDLGLQRVVLFGGNNPFTPSTNVTWLYDGSNWTQAPVTGPRPTARAQGRMFWDSLRSRTVLVGGGDPSANVLGDTWTFNGVSWTQELGAAPAPRIGHTVAFDVIRGQGVLFGGQDNAGQFADTWIYDGAVVAPFGTGCPGSNGVPQLSASAGPRLGLVFQSTLTGLLPLVPIAALATGFSATSYNGVPLPADMSPAGITGCTLYCSLDILGFPSATGGVATESIVVPASTVFFGLQFYQQGASLDPGINPFGAVLSNALRATVGL